jgi:hypothetical protein
VSTINGLPAHVLLVHFVVVLMPLTAVFVITAAFWRSLRDLLWWAGVLLAAGLVVLCRLTQQAGEWFSEYIGNPPTLSDHAGLGDTAIWFAVALLIVAIAEAFVHFRQRGSDTAGKGLVIGVAVLAIVVGVASCVQIYRIGDSGAKAVWGSVVAPE